MSVFHHSDYCHLLLIWDLASWNRCKCSFCLPQILIWCKCSFKCLPQILIWSVEITRPVCKACVKEVTVMTSSHTLANASTIVNQSIPVIWQQTKFMHASPDLLREGCFDGFSNSFFPFDYLPYLLLSLCMKKPHYTNYHFQLPYIPWQSILQLNWLLELFIGFVWQHLILVHFSIQWWLLLPIHFHITRFIDYYLCTISD